MSCLRPAAGIACTVVDLERAAAQLRQIAETVEIATALGVPIWLRGGWAMDFFLGELTRDHVDIDWFGWADDAVELSTTLGARGYRFLPEQPNGPQFDVEKDGLESSFTQIAKDELGRLVVPAGPWAGEVWPEGMLEAVPGRIGEQQCLIVSPAAQIEIKRMMPVWVPTLRRRPKDAEDIARLEAALSG
jgi:hypothetical protein